jgi:hypothetical protein
LPGAAPVQLLLDFFGGEGKPGGASVDNHADAASVAFTPGGDTEKGSKAAAHGFKREGIPAGTGKKIVAIVDADVKILPMMRTRFLLLNGLILAGLGWLMPVPPVHALNGGEWTLEAILERVVEANGGEESLAAATNLRILGEVERASGEYEFLLLKKRPDKIRIHLLKQGRVVETAFNGEVGWRRFRDDGQERVVELSQEGLRAANLNLDFDGPLIGEPAPGMKRSFEGVERVGRADYFVIKLEGPDFRSRHYIDPRTFREMQTISSELRDGEVVAEVKTEFYQYRRHGGIWMAERLKRHLPDGTTETVRVRKAEVNPGILDQAFEKPGSWSTVE